MQKTGGQRSRFFIVNQASGVVYERTYKQQFDYKLLRKVNIWIAWRVKERVNLIFCHPDLRKDLIFTHYRMMWNERENYPQLKLCSTGP